MWRNKYVLQQDSLFTRLHAYLYGLSDDPFVASCTYHFEHHCLYTEDYTQGDLYQPIIALTPTPTHPRDVQLFIGMLIQKWSKVKMTVTSHMKNTIVNYSIYYTLLTYTVLTIVSS